MPPTQLEKDLGIGYLVTDIARLMTTQYNRIMKPTGLTRAQWRVIIQLNRRNGQTQSELAHVLDMGKVSVGGLIDRLEESYWIERRADPKDRRANRIYLTSKADEINDEMTKTGQRLIDQTLRNLSADERETLINLLIAVKRNLLEDLPIEIDDVERQ
jgi:DNA-binding MarR family transcriptional regulator